MANVAELIKEIREEQNWVRRTVIARTAVRGVTDQDKRESVADRLLEEFGESQDGYLPEIGRTGFCLGVRVARLGR